MGCPLELVEACLLVVELGSCGVESDHEVAVSACCVAGLLDCLHDDFESLFVGLEVGSESTFITDACVVALGFENALEVVEDLCDHSDCFSLCGSADRHDHELLEVNLVVGVCAAVEDVCHRNGEDTCMVGAEILVQRQSEILGCGVCDCH